MVVRRNVILRTAMTRRPLIYAESTIVPGHLPHAVSRRLIDSDDPLGLVLRAQRLETFRELQDWAVVNYQPQPGR
jgi:chorismate-pyruvate lyase